MLKLSPNDKKLIALLLLMFVIVFSVIIIDLFLNAQMLIQAKNDFTMPSEWDQMVKKISTAPKDTRPAMIRKSLNEIFNLMNNKDYENLFNLVSNDFKESNFNNDLDTFIKFMNTYGDEMYSPYFTEFKQFDNTYMVIVSFVPSSNTDEDIIKTQNPKKNDTFFLHYVDENTYTFSFLGYVGEKKVATGFGNEDFSVILDKTVLYKSKSEFHFTIINNSDMPMSLPAESLYCYTGFLLRPYPVPINLAPHTSLDCSFSVATGLSIPNAIPEEICFKNVTVNGKKYAFDIPTIFCVNI